MTLIRGRKFAFRDRRVRKRQFRRLWITRINAAVREEGLTYNRFIQGLRLAEIEVDRKILADLAVNDVETFNTLVAAAKAAIAEAPNATGAIPAAA